MLISLSVNMDSPHITTSIHILDDDSLLNVFYLYRPALLVGKDDDDENCFKTDRQQWVNERWWHHLTHVCQRWRNLIFGSASYLRLSLLCTTGTPVADMLAHSPPLPLVVEYSEEFPGISEEDEEGVILALKQRNRVLRIYFHVHITTLQKLIVAIEKEYPILEFLIIWSWTDDDTMSVMFPETFHAQHLHHLALHGVTIPIGSQLLTTAVRLVALCLVMSHSSIYVHSNTLLQWLSFMPQLETLNISLFFISDSDEERQLTHSPVMTPVTLPNLHHFLFRSPTSTYLDALVHRITPCPEDLDIYFPNQLNPSTFSVPRLVQFMKTTWNLKFESAIFMLSTRKASVVVYPHGEAKTYGRFVTIRSWDFDWLVSYVAQVFNSLDQVFSAVERLTLELADDSDDWTLQEPDVGQDRFDHIEWRQFLGSFSNVKTLCIDNVFIKGVSRCLELDNGGLQLELLPELQELTYSQSGKSGDAFTSFIDARQNADRPVTVTHC
jgi:hypothetical protein